MVDNVWHFNSSTHDHIDKPYFHEKKILKYIFVTAIITGDNHVTCGQLSKPDVATLSYRRSHY